MSSSVAAHRALSVRMPSEGGQSSTMNSYSLRTWSMTAFRYCSLAISEASSTSTPTRLMLAGMRSRKRERVFCTERWTLSLLGL